MAERSAEDLKFRTATQILVVLTAHGQSGQAAMPHLEKKNKLEVLSNQPSMVEMLVQGIVHDHAQVCFLASKQSCNEVGSLIFSNICSVFSNSSKPVKT